MYISQHSDFILSPLKKILKDGIAASRAAGDGIDSYPMGEYLMQSLFLKKIGKIKLYRKKNAAKEAKDA